jgi:hypothetical protein
MTHKDRAKAYFREEYFRSHGVMGPEDKKKIDKMFHHLFEAIKHEIAEDMAVVFGQIVRIQK